MALATGTKLSMIASPNYGDNEFVFFVVGQQGVREIVVGHESGPMGYYAVAVVKWESGAPDQIHPLHMLDTYRLAEPA